MVESRPHIVVTELAAWRSTFTVLAKSRRLGLRKQDEGASLAKYFGYIFYCNQQQCIGCTLLDEIQLDSSRGLFVSNPISGSARYRLLFTVHGTSSKQYQPAATRPAEYEPTVPAAAAIEPT